MTVDGRPADADVTRHPAAQWQPDRARMRRRLAQTDPVGLRPGAGPPRAPELGDPYISGMATGVETKTISARGAAEITYDVRGGGAPTVVFIHGWSCRRAYFDGVVEALGESGTFVTIDLPAHGDSTAGSGPWSMERFGQDVLDVIDAEGLSDVVLVGHSMGAPVALEAARLAPDKIRSVVALDALSRLEVYRVQPAETIAPTIERLTPDLPAGVALMMNAMFSSDPKDGIKERVIREMGSIAPEPGLAALQSLMRWDMDAALSATDVPVAILAARAIMSPEAPAALGDRCDLRPLDLEGHFFCIEQPKETADELRPLVGL